MHRGIKAPKQPGQGEIRDLKEHHREMRVLKGGEQGEAGAAEAPKTGQLHMAVAAQALAGAARC